MELIIYMRFICFYISIIPYHISGPILNIKIIYWHKESCYKSYYKRKKAETLIQELTSRKKRRAFYLI